MSLKAKILLAILIVFIGIQFIQPARNKSGQILPSEITKLYKMPDNVQVVFKTACYDCHSNNTIYPWYSDIQPTGWWLERHITKGKEELNFSEFGVYSSKRQVNKLRAIENSINDGTMPLTSYALLHKKARLTIEDKELLINWINKTKDSLLIKN